MSRIVVVGGLTMDLHLFGIEESSGQAPLIAERYLAAPGGKGANVARAAARLGADVALVGRVGDDEFGRHCVKSVAADGVDISGGAVDGPGADRLRRHRARRGPAPFAAVRPRGERSSDMDRCRTRPDDTRRRRHHHRPGRDPAGRAGRTGGSSRLWPQRTWSARAPNGC